jgi:hypothetical protein
MQQFDPTLPPNSRPPLPNSQFLSPLKLTPLFSNNILQVLLTLLHAELHSITLSLP